MRTVSVAEAKAHLTRILTRVEKGDEVVITRRGRPVARLSSVLRPSKPIDFAALEALRARQPVAKTPAVQLVRRLRNQDY